MTCKFTTANDLNWERLKKYKVTFADGTVRILFCTATVAKEMKDTVKVEEMITDGNSKEVKE